MSLILKLFDRIPVFGALRSLRPVQSAMRQSGSRRLFFPPIRNTCSRISG